VPGDIDAGFAFSKSRQHRLQALIEVFSIQVDIELLAPVPEFLVFDAGLSEDLRRIAGSDHLGGMTCFSFTTLPSATIAPSPISDLMLSMERMPIIA
jgi:hypothetical protein